MRPLRDLSDGRGAIYPRSILWTLGAVALSVFPAFPGTFTAFGPQNYERGTSDPVTVTNTFSVRNPATSYTLRIRNGGLADGEFEKVSSSIIALNGVQVVGPEEFNQNVTSLEKPVTLRSSNQISVEVRGKPGGAVSIDILGIDNDPPTISATVSPAPNAAGWNNSNVTVTFTCDDATSGVATCSAPVTLASEGAAQVVTGTATDKAGNSATASVTVNLDKTPPNLSIVTPAAGALLSSSSVVVTGTVSDGLSGLAAVTCQGAAATVSGTDFACSVSLVAGPNSIVVRATDVAGNAASQSVSVTFLPPITVRITSPAPLTVFGASPINVTGTVDDSNARVVVNGVTATTGGGTFTATGVPLREGSNILTATATGTLGNVGAGSVTVVLDTTPPRIRIAVPADGAVLNSPQVTVSGVVNDAVSGTVNAGEVAVTVNGVTAAVSNRSFVVPDLPLAAGTNTITATARDRAGNVGSHTIQVSFQSLTGPRIALVSGNNQTAVIGTALAAPLVVSLTGADGNPAAAKPVTFSVTRGDGSLSGGGQSGRSLSVVTDSFGRAQISFTLGTRSGVGNNQVTAQAAGFSGQVVFSASATAAAAAQINVVSGENQRGVVGAPLPLPFVAIVFDRGGNPVAGVPVTFTIVQGDGNLEGAATVNRTTDSDGKAAAVLTLGLAEGINNHIVTAAFTGLSGSPAFFTASAVMPGLAADTRVSGVVLDNANRPIPNATAKIVGTTLSALTDAEGRFSIAGAPVGTITLIVDGSTSTRPETFPFLAFQMTTIAGQDNTIGMPILLPPLDTQNSQVVGGDQAVTLTMAGVAGVSFTVFPRSVTFPDGSKTGRLTLSQVHADKVPMPPPNGTAPRLVGTLQPAGVHFDPPIRVQVPNTEGLAPGQVIDFVSFDHDLEQFVSVGTASVSEDGMLITTDPGFGITKSGWWAALGLPQPVTTVQGPPCPIPGGTNPVVGSRGELAHRTPGRQGDGRYGGGFRTNRDGTPRFHPGIDIVAPVGNRVNATEDGIVIAVCARERCTESGNQISIRHPNGLVSRYFHLLDGSITVGVGQQVSRGAQIGAVGTTGNARNTDQPHLHLQVGTGTDRTSPTFDPTGCVR